MLQVVIQTGRGALEETVRQNTEKIDLIIDKYNSYVDWGSFVEAFLFTFPLIMVVLAWVYVWLVERRVRRLEKALAERPKSETMVA